VLLAAEAVRPHSRVDKLRLLQKDGRLLLDFSSRTGFRRGVLDSLAGVESALEIAHDYVGKWREHGGLRRHKIHPRLERFIDYCQR
jgi:hypothetical protein